MTHKEYMAERMKDPEFKAAYDELEPEYEIIMAMLNAREEKGMTQQALSEATGIQQSDISRLETGNYNPSLKQLKRIAKGLGKQLHISFQ